ncbi:tetratricopeptide repeat protein [Flagellimonas sp. CMM7]|uniref:tetratricopeptide repeat protein n=1 Tax=Flagellimonas sp. CMM7 TaxID=2654676 RepID=UPI0013D2D1C9|nr:tetratricopeptide repeat protein [Flagellimonas sp. CMM7]UII81084.1 tetratricopeptide repeat protein [Flagellimonas sp. CMM7]
MSLSVCLVYTQEQTKGDSLSDLADGYYRKNEFGKAIGQERLALLWYQQLEEASKISSKLNNIGLYHYMLAQYDSSLYYYKQSLKIDLDLGDQRRVISRYKNIGITYKKMGDFNTSIEYYLKALNISHNTKNRKELGSIYNSVANILLIQEKPKEAIQYLKNASKELLVQKDTSGYSKAINNLGSAHFKLAQYDSAMYYYKRAVTLKRVSSKTTSVAANLNNIGEVFLAMKQVDSALIYFKQALDLKLVEKNAQSIVLTSNNIAKVYLDQSKAREASKYLDISETNLKSTDSKNLLAEFHYLKSRWNELTGNTILALDHYKKWKSLQDQIFQTEQLEVAEKLNQYEKNLIEGEKRKAQEQVLWQQKLNQQQNTVIWVIAIALVIGAVLLFIIGRSREKLKNLNYQLEDKNRMVEKLNIDLNILVEEVKHRKQNDFNRLMGTIEQIEEHNEGLIGLFSQLYSTIISTSDIDDFLESSDDGHIIDICEFFIVLIRKLSVVHRLEEKNVVFDHQIASRKIPANTASILAFITCELVNNSVKYGVSRTRNPKFGLHISFKKEECHFSYSDNGDNEHFKESFTNSKNLGWSIVNRLIASLNGNPKLSREAGQSLVTFTFDLITNKI